MSLPETPDWPVLNTTIRSRTSGLRAHFLGRPLHPFGVGSLGQERGVVTGSGSVRALSTTVFPFAQLPLTSEVFRLLSADSRIGSGKTWNPASAQASSQRHHRSPASRLAHGITSHLSGLRSKRCHIPLCTASQLPVWDQSAWLKPLAVTFSPTLKRHEEIPSSAT